MLTVRKMSRIVVACLVILAAATPFAWSMSYENADIRAGQRAVDFTMIDPGGREVKMEDLAGKVIVLSFWECYADSCFTSTRAIEDLVGKYPLETFVAVSVCSSFPQSFIENGYAKLLKNCGRGQTILLDPDKKAMHGYKVTHTPTTFIIGRDGMIWKRAVGLAELRMQDFRDLVDSLVSER